VTNATAATETDSKELCSGYDILTFSLWVKKSRSRPTKLLSQVSASV